MNHYILHFVTLGVKYKLSYKNGRFFRAERKAGFLDDDKRAELGKYLPPRESDIIQYNERFDRRVVYTPFKKKTASMYQKFVSAWMQFYQYEFGIAPKFSGVEGKALKQIIKYLSEIGGSEEKAYTLFAQILQNFNKLDDFHQQNFDLKYLNGNINRIIKNVRKSSKKSTSYSDDFKQKIADRLQSK